MKYTRLIVTGIGLMVIGAACGKTSITTTGNANGQAANSAVTNTVVANTINPCSLITPDEAAAVFGKPAKAPEVKGTACRYDTVDASKFFDLTAKPGTTADFEVMKNACEPGAEPVTGLDATSCAANNTVVVLKNSIVMTIIAGGVFDQAQLKDLAVTAAGRIL